MLVKSLLSDKIKDLLQKSIESELYASNLYKHLSNQMQRLGFFGMQKYFLDESADELTHYQKIVDFINDNGDVAMMPKVDAVKDKIGSIGDALQVAYETELDLLNQYKNFYSQCLVEDVTVAIFLEQYITIQINSVGEFGDLIATYNQAEATGEILLFDKEINED